MRTLLSFLGLGALLAGVYLLFDSLNPADDVEPDVEVSTREVTSQLVNGEHAAAKL